MTDTQGPRVDLGRRLGIVVVNFGSSALLREHLVGFTEGRDDVVVVVDNWSTPGEREAVRRLAGEHGWLVEEPDANLGFGGGCNVGVRRAVGEGVGHVLLVNPDATIDSDSIEALLEVVREQPLTLAAPVVRGPDGTVWSAGTDVLLATGDMRSWARRVPGERHLPWLSGACLMLSVGLWDRVGGFDEDYFLYWEDVDLSARVLAVGGDLQVVQAATATHHEGGTHSGDAGARAKSALYYYYNVRNRLLFARRRLSADDRRRWRRGSLGAAWRVLLRGGRRQFFHPTRNLWPALRGTVDGWRAGGPAERPLRSRVRVYEGLRSAHLERFHELEPATVFHADRNYDFADELVEGLDIRRFDGSVELVKRLLRADVRQLEVNEPLMLSAVKNSLLATLTVRIAARLRGRQVSVVSYAIGNEDPFVTPSPRLRSRWRRFVYLTMVRVLMLQLDRIAVGTDGAMAEYRPYRLRRTAEIRLIPALPRPCTACDLGRPRTGVVFLGAFDERKGLRPLLTAWPMVRSDVPGTPLTILGKGDLVALAEDAAERWSEVALEVDPTRDAIHHALAGAAVLVLLSQPTPTWREQVGLPIVEGLSHGCEIVATTETGIAPWLQEHGHQVIDAYDQEPARIADAIRRALQSPRTPADVCRDLPPVDGRLDADRWMFRD